MFIVFAYTISLPYAISLNGASRGGIDKTPANSYLCQASARADALEQKRKGGAFPREQ